MTAGVFVITDGGNLVEMQPKPFGKEIEFQNLLEQHPNLLSGDQIDPESPRKWLLLSREAAIPSEDNGSDRWALDHLFVDQDGIPTFVEVKRREDARLRREVVGQMLDYAANATAYWHADALRMAFQTGHPKAVEEIQEKLGQDVDVDTLWQKFGQNLKDGRVRLLFVADHIPPELRRIVEFLNEQMDPAEVLALELRHYEGSGMKTIVPLVYGQTQKLQQIKSPRPPARDWTEDEAFARIRERRGDAAFESAHKIINWMRENKAEISTGRGVNDISIRCGFKCNGHQFNPVKVWTNGYVEISLGSMPAPPFTEAKKKELLDRFNKIDGLNWPDATISQSSPSIPLKLLSDATKLGPFFAAMKWFTDELRTA